MLAGRDVLGVMPTGAGKSVVYQIPALLLPGLTLVVSPLISLMKDQVAGLEQAGIPAACVNSTQSADEQARAFSRALSGDVKLLYVAPERLSTPRMAELAQVARISLVAVDEAHCVSQWGQDFRPDYRAIAGFVEGLPVRPAVAALTATATEEVRRDIVDALELRDPFVLVGGFDRPNLYFGVERPEPRDKDRTLLRLVAARAAKRDSAGQVGQAGQTGIVYCSTRKAVEHVCELLWQEGFASTRYHAGLSPEERHANQEEFLGAAFGGLVNYAQTFTGFACGLVNVAYDVTGCQLGLINACDRMHGVQIGLLNLINESKLPVMVISNAAF